MRKKKKKASRFFRSFRYFIVTILALAFVSLGIDAADNRGNLQESLLARFLFGEKTSLCDEGMIYVETENGDFCLDQFENSASEKCPAVNPDNGQETRQNLDEINCSPVSKQNALPWVNISQEQAMAACARAGKRLPTPQEWYAAVLGTPDQADGWTSDDCQVANNWPSQPGLTGSGKNCRSGIGAYDMIGNVWEWVKGTANDGNYENKVLPAAGYIESVDEDGLPLITNDNKQNENLNEDYFWLKSGVRGIARGGYWGNGSDAGNYATYMVSPPNFSGPGIGFRCVKAVNR